MEISINDLGTLLKRRSVWRLYGRAIYKRELIVEKRTFKSKTFELHNREYISYVDYIFSLDIY